MNMCVLNGLNLQFFVRAHDRDRARGSAPHMHAYVRMHAGKYRQEGKQYVVRDGDIINWCVHANSYI
jgi:hypothetical protein